MSMRSLTLFTLLALALPAWATSPYRITELPPSELGDFVPVTITNRGEVAGTIWGVFGGRVEPRAARWTPTDGLEVLDPEIRSYAIDMNENGAIVGQWAGCATAVASLGAFLWTEHDGFQCLPSLDGTAASVNAINNRGEMVGGVHASLSPTTPVYWSSLTSPPQLVMDGFNGALEDINQKGTAAGWVVCPPEGTCEDGNDFTVNPPAEPRTFAGEASTIAINELNVVLSVWGHLTWPNGRRQPLGIPEGCESLGTYDLNNALQVVGDAVCHEIQDLRGLLWHKGRWVDLTATLGDPQWVLRSAVAVNEGGRILGSGEKGGVYRIFILSPQGAKVAGR